MNRVVTPLAFQHGIGGHGRAVHHAQVFAGQSQIFYTLEYGLFRRVGRGQQLVHAKSAIAPQNEIGESAARIDAQ